MQTILSVILPVLVGVFGALAAVLFRDRRKSKTIIRRARREAVAAEVETDELRAELLLGRATTETEGMSHEEIAADLDAVLDGRAGRVADDGSADTGEGPPHWNPPPDAAREMPGGGSPVEGVLDAHGAPGPSGGLPGTPDTLPGDEDAADPCPAGDRGPAGALPGETEGEPVQGGGVAAAADEASSGTGDPLQEVGVDSGRRGERVGPGIPGGAPGSVGTVAQAIAQAEHELSLDIQERRGANGFERIDLYIRSAGGLGWSWLKPYVRNGSYAWCGAFVAWCFAAAGFSLAIRRAFFSSTWRLYRLARYLPSTGSYREPKGTKAKHLAAGCPRRVQILVQGRDLTWEPRAGDILLVGPRNDDKPWAKHVALVRGFDRKRGMILTYEGNARGPGPKGKNREGVVKSERPLPTKANRNRYHCRCLIRLSPLDFAA